MLDLDPSRAPVAPRPASTVLAIRRAPSGDDDIEILCVVRHVKSGFLGGVVAFPGGKVDASDASSAWDDLASDVHPRLRLLVDPPAPPRALAIAAARELFEEVAILPTVGDVIATRDAIEMRASGAKLDEQLRRRGAKLDLARLHPFARWVTPVAESRRFDAAFFVFAVPDGHAGLRDDRETTDAFWATPRDVLARWEAGSIQIAPPTVRCLELLVHTRTVEGAIAIAAEQSLLPICPRFVADEQGVMLALPGDPAHDVSERRVAGPTRFVLRDGRFVGRDPPEEKLSG